jgi:UDP-N-acetyl-D-mannosaminuronic acid transferase (WecB/TagA/CpsF family)
MKFVTKKTPGYNDNACIPPPQVGFWIFYFAFGIGRGVVRQVIESSKGPFRYVVTPNAHHVAVVHDDPQRLLPVYRAAWLSLCDGHVLRSLAGLDGPRLPLLTGGDLVAALLSELNNARTEARLPLLIVGPSATVGTAFSATYPHIAFDVFPGPEGLAGMAALQLSMAKACLSCPRDILLRCVGCPAQELIAHELARVGCPADVALGVGAAIDLLTKGAKPGTAVVAKAELRMGLSVDSGAWALGDATSSNRQRCYAFLLRGARRRRRFGRSAN